MIVRVRMFGLAKTAFFAAWAVLLIGAAFSLGIYVAVKKPVLLAQIRSAYVDARGLLTFQSPKLVANEFDQPEGLTYFSDSKDDGFLLLSGYFPDEEMSGIKLISLSDGSVMKSWYPDPAAIRAQSTYEDFYPIERFQPLSPMLMNDGGLIFIDDQGPLVRIDACSRIDWILDGKFHHSLEKGPNGNLFVPLGIEDFEVAHGVEIRDDAVAEVSPEGKLQSMTSVAGILLRGGYRGLLIGMTPLDSDPLHLNDVEVAASSTERWERGDWLLSLRSRSAVLLYRPSLDRIMWMKLGPWTLQHDPDFLNNGKISIFGNDGVKFSGEDVRMLEPFSNIYIMEPNTGLVSKPYETVFRTERIYTPTQGKADILLNDDAYIEETDRGRISRISQKGFVWVYQNSYGEGAGVLHWSRYLEPADVANVDLTDDCGDG